MTAGHGYVASGGQHGQLDVRRLCDGEVVLRGAAGGSVNNALALAPSSGDGSGGGCGNVTLFVCNNDCSIKAYSLPPIPVISGERGGSLAPSRSGGGSRRRRGVRGGGGGRRRNNNRNDRGGVEEEENENDENGMLISDNDEEPNNNDCDDFSEQDEEMEEEENATAATIAAAFEDHHFDSLEQQERRQQEEEEEEEEEREREQQQEQRRRRRNGSNLDAGRETLMASLEARVAAAVAAAVGAAAATVNNNSSNGDNALRPRSANNDNLPRGGGDGSGNGNNAPPPSSAAAALRRRANATTAANTNASASASAAAARAARLAAASPAAVVRCLDPINYCAPSPASARGVPGFSSNLSSGSSGAISAATLAAVGDCPSLSLHAPTESGYSPLASWDLFDDAGMACAWSASGSFVAAVAQCGSVAAVDPRVGRRAVMARNVLRSSSSSSSPSTVLARWRTPGGGAARALKMSPAGSATDLLLVTEHDTFAHLVDARRFDAAQTLEVGLGGCSRTSDTSNGNGGSSSLFSRGGLFYGGGGGGINNMSSSSSGPTANGGHHLSGAAFSPEGDLVFIGAEDGGVAVFDVRTAERCCVGECGYR